MMRRVELYHIDMSKDRPSRDLITLSDEVIAHEHTDVTTQRDRPTYLQEDTHTL